MTTDASAAPLSHGPSGWSALVGPVLTYGLGAAVAVWCGWFITHLPWLGLDERLSLPILLLIWLAGMVVAGAGVGRGAAWKVGLGAGLVAALLGLLILGSKLAAPAGDDAALRPGAGLIVLGFLGLGAALGLVGGALGGLIRARPTGSPDWLARFALVAAVAVAPLLFVGGLVTSTDSGMAVPDWPNTYGANMFLYPLGPRVAPDIYLEHSHRLFGTLVGLATLVLMVWVLIADDRRRARSLAAIAFGLVVVQGVLGGGRVLFGSPDLAADNRYLALIHGVLAQLVFGLVVALAIVLTPTFRGGPLAPPPPRARAARFWTTGLLHAMILQLVLGAAYRHLRSMHALWSHAAFSIVVVIFALAAGFVLMALAANAGRIPAILRRTGVWLLGVVVGQFLLGWSAFFLTSSQHQAQTALEAIVRTLHQANGALLLALVTLAFVWTRRMIAAAPAPASAA